MSLPDEYGYKKYWYKSKSWDITLPIAYAILFPPDYDQEKEYPLLVSIPGSGEVGINNTTQLRWGVGNFIRGDIENIENPNSIYNKTNCITIVIQPIDSHSYDNYNIKINSYRDLDVNPYRSNDIYHPDYKYHSHPYLFKTNSFFILTVIDFVKDILKNKAKAIDLYTNSDFSTIDKDTILPKIDSNRVYYSGGSWGGAAGFSLLQSGRDIFAAAIIYAGWGIGYPYVSYSKNSSMLERLLKEFEKIGNIPVMITCSSYDTMSLGHADIESVYPYFGETEDCISVYEDRYFSDWVVAHCSALAWSNAFNLNKYFSPKGKSSYSTIREEGDITGIEWLFSKTKREQTIDPYPPTNNFPMGNYCEDVIYLTEEDGWKLSLNKEYYYIEGKTNIIKNQNNEYIYIHDEYGMIINGRRIKENESFLIPPNRITCKNNNGRKYFVYKNKNKWGLFRG